MTPPIVIKLLATLAIVCGLAPLPEPWEPDLADVALISRTIWGEARGCEPEVDGKTDMAPAVEQPTGPGMSRSL